MRILVLALLVICANKAMSQIDSTIGPRISGDWMLRFKVNVNTNDTAKVGKYVRDVLHFSCTRSTFDFSKKPPRGSLVMGSTRMTNYQVIKPLQYALKSLYPSDSFTLVELDTSILAFRYNEFIYIFEPIVED